MSYPEFYVNGTDFPPQDETIAEGSLFHKANGEMLRKVQGTWISLSDLQVKEEEHKEN